MGKTLDETKKELTEILNRGARKAAKLASPQDALEVARAWEQTRADEARAGLEEYALKMRQAFIDEGIDTREMHFDAKKSLVRFSAQVDGKTVNVLLKVIDKDFSSVPGILPICDKCGEALEPWEHELSLVSLGQAIFRTAEHECDEDNAPQQELSYLRTMRLALETAEESDDAGQEYVRAIAYALAEIAERGIYTINPALEH